MADQRPIGYWLKLVDGLIEGRFADLLEEHGVTRRQWQLLNLLRRGPADVHRLDAAIAPFLAAGAGESSAEHLTELIESGWVAATPAGYELTDRGSVAVTRLGEVVDGMRDSIGRDVADEDYARTVTTLERMARNLGWTGADD
ncbi:hypothetical protein CLV46_3240 [Diaminobutyricimonas aerilata]|uniref:DNA-binding MarR family transcriptional regulator n=1 Tax=Diaminobutyricimonas aerilata TaxID=1162967 RepID=A0A2M9CP12_9MICO|nr:transcriptional regulator [Diaminobutyricimonas aerilata]PJJ73646.1 hypothetical protein CLV46_3240 [Diaminobutyricimonas aerilata]